MLRETSVRLARRRAPRPFIAGALLVLLGFSWLVALGASLSEVRGVVHDAQHRPLGGAHVQLRARNSDWTRSTDSSAEGEFVLGAVPLGEYELSVTHPGFAASVLPVTVVSGAAPSRHVQLASGASEEETVTVSAPLPASAEVFTPSVLVSREEIANTPGADRSNSLAMITNFMPGAYFVHDQLHVRGGHQVSWEIDGVEIPNTNIASNLGPQIDPKDIDYLEAQGGSYPADAGDRTYGVFNVVPRTGFERNDEAELVLSAGNYGQSNDALSIGGHSNDLAYYGSLTGDRSSLGLMTPSESILHDAEDGYGLFSSLIWNLGADDQLRLMVMGRRDDYDIPNTPGQVAADVQREADAFSILSWMHAFSEELTLTSSFFYHYNRADFDGGAGDYPIDTTAQRASSYLGGQESLRFTLGRNDLTAGLYGFTQSDNQFFDVRFNDGSSPQVTAAFHPGGSLQAAYFQDSYRLTSWMRLSAGMRQTHFGGLIEENATDPRLGVTIQAPELNWVIRAFWGKYYQAPPLATLAGPLLQFATASALGFLPLRGERDREVQFGVTVPVAGWTVDVDWFRTQARNFFDHNPIGNSDVFLPITITGALIRATELSVRSPRFWHALQAHIAYSNQTADGFGTVSGGLTDFSPPGGAYALDHDQRNTLNAGLDAQLPWQSFAGFNLYYGSGFSNGKAPPSHLPSHASVDLSLGKDFWQNFRLSLTVLEIANRHLLVDNSLTFDGVHWNNPREVYVEFRYHFHY